MITTVFTVLSFVFAAIYYASTWKFGYWKKRKVPYLDPVPLLGNYGSFITQRKFMGRLHQELCQQLPNVPYFGAFYGTEPTLVVQDPQVIKTVMTKDFYYFNSREIAKYTDKELVSQNLFFTYGDRWKVLRQNLTPIFTPAKMKNMFYLIDKCAHVFEGMLDYEFKKNNVQKVRPLMARFTMDCITACAFGADVGTMGHDSKNNRFTVMGEKIFMDSYWTNIKNVFRSIWPAIFYGLRLRNFPVDVIKSFTQFMKQVFVGRDYKPTKRNDFIDLILNWKKDNYITGDTVKNMKGEEKKVKLLVDDEMLVGQCSMFFAAGFETSATTLHYTLYELAKNPQAQQRVFEEIDSYLSRHNNKLEFECITEMPFTDACFDETLRLYPVLAVLTREVVEDYTLPCGAVIGEGVRVHIPVYHLHHNPDFFPDPEEYRPERFYGEEKKNIKPYSYLPFGEGPRLCIGMRFAKMQMLAGLITILKKYRVEVTQRPPKQMEFSPTSFVTQPKKRIELKFLEREGWQQRQYSPIQ
ncbi:cytochrome P450 6B5-like [Plodia interpunctella]|uniref:cytochrome P450 6B5-like n=1 Tax=Plodia interpunctella TaxID=58824 RepID=UPI0023680C16|nr:cytochrome P450 6B5-like [Plodia interpunctella]